MGSLRRIGRNISRPIRQVSSQASRFASQAAAQARRTAQQAQAQAQRAARQAKAQAERTARQAAETAKRTARQTAEQAGRLAKQASPKRALTNLAIRPTASVAGALGAKSFSKRLMSENPVKAAISLGTMALGGPAGLVQASSIPGIRGSTNRLMKSGIKDWDKRTGLKVPSFIADNPARAARYAGAAVGLGGLALGGGAGLMGPQSAAGLTPAGSTPVTAGMSNADKIAAITGSPDAWASTQMPSSSMMYDAPYLTGGAAPYTPGPLFGGSTGIGSTPALYGGSGAAGTAFAPAAAAGAAPAAASAGAGGMFGGGWLGNAVGLGGLGLLGYSVFGPKEKVPKAQELPPLPPEEPFSMPGGAYIDAGSAMPYAEDVAGIAGDIQGLGQQQIDDYNALYRPLLSQYAGLAAQGYDGDFYANRASADVAGQFAQAQGEQQRGLSRLGLNPNAPAYQSQMFDMALAQAAAEAGVRTDARQWAADASRNALAQGAQFGQGIFSSGLGALGNAANAYNGLNSDYTGIAGANANTAASAYQNAYQARQDYQSQLYQMQLANQQNAYQNQMNQFSANQSNNNAMLGLAGTLTGAWLFG